MPSSIGPKKNKLKATFADYLEILRSHIALVCLDILFFYLPVFCLYIMVSNFVVLWCVYVYLCLCVHCVCVLSLCLLLLSLLLVYFIIVCFYLPVYLIK